MVFGTALQAAATKKASTFGDPEDFLQFAKDAIILGTIFFPTSIEVLPATDRNVPVKSKTVLEIKHIKSAPPHRRNKSLRVPQQ